MPTSNPRFYITLSPAELQAIRDYARAHGHTGPVVDTIRRALRQQIPDMPHETQHGGWRGGRKDSREGKGENVDRQES